MEERYADCDICGERFHGEFIMGYLTDTWVADADGDEECVTHCKTHKRADLLLHAVFEPEGGAE